ncbi:MAG: hypothetical protein PVI91_01460 [Gammaproteobacteria bacterium]|jgi:hypothetical protein
MQHLSRDFMASKPECLEARDSLDLMITLSEHDRVATLADLLWMITHAEKEYSRLVNYRRKRSVGRR